MTKKQQIQRIKTSQYDEVRQENERLKAELAKMQIRLRAASVGAGAAVDDLVERVYTLERDNAELSELLHSLTPDIVIYPQKYLSPYDEVTWVGQSCIVDVRIAVRSDKNGFMVYSLSSLFNGAQERARVEILPRVFAAIWRGPMPENLRGPAIPGVDVQTLITAVTDVAVYLHDDLADLYHANFDKIYREQIYPKVDFTRITEDDARKHFRLVVDKTIENMRANRQMPTKPAGKPGAKRKNQHN